jgi:hypothetical protein
MAAAGRDVAPTAAGEQAATLPARAAITVSETIRTLSRMPLASH